MEVTKEQAADITTLYSVYIVGTLFLPNEFEAIAADLRGLDQLPNLEGFGLIADEDSNEKSLWRVLNTSQTEPVYFKLVDYFRSRDVAKTWPHLDITTISKGNTRPNSEYKAKLSNTLVEKTDKLKRLVSESKLPAEKKEALTKRLDEEQQKFFSYLYDEDNAFYYYLKNREPSIDLAYTNSELTIRKELLSYKLGELIRTQLEELNKDIENNAGIIERLNNALKEALTEVEKAADTEELKRTEDKEMTNMVLRYPTELVAEAERRAKLAQDAVTTVDSDHNNKVTLEEKTVVDKAITHAQTAFKLAEKAVTELADDVPVKEGLKARLGAIIIPDSPKLSPVDSDENVTQPDEGAAPAPGGNPSAPVPGGNPNIKPSNYPPYIPPTAKPTQALDVTAILPTEKREVKLPQTSDNSVAFASYALTGALSVLTAYGLKRKLEAGSA